MFGALYRNKAKECARMANSAADPQDRDELLEEEKRWLRIAKQMESYSEKAQQASRKT